MAAALGLGPFLLWPSGPPSLYSLFPAAAGLELPRCEAGRVLTLQTPPLRGDDVTEVQEALRRQGIYEGEVDGVFGEATAAAVKVFRLKHGLAGIPRVDNAFWRALGDERPALGGQDTTVAATATPAPPPGADLLIQINIEAMRLTLYVDGYPYKSYPVAVGRPSSPSAVGQWRIRNKSVNVGTPFGTRWMGLSVPWGTYGVHGTWDTGSIGTAASGGCIRMFNWNVEELYEWVPIGTPVHIYSPSWVANVRPSLPEGSIGLSVVFIQWQMQRLGWNVPEADGRLGAKTVQAIRDVEAFYGLNVDGIADTDVLCFLDLDR